MTTSNSPQHSAALAVDTSGDDVLIQAEAWLAEGRQIAVATVINTWGSSPRQPGSQLLADDRGNFLGSVSGGCVEASVIDAAQTVITTGKAALLEFGVADETAWEVGLACGGRIEIFVEKVS